MENSETPKRKPGPARAIIPPEQTALAITFASRRKPSAREMARGLGMNHTRWLRAMRLEAALTAAEITAATALLA